MKILIVLKHHAKLLVRLERPAKLALRLALTICVLCAVSTSQVYSQSSSTSESHIPRNVIHLPKVSNTNSRSESLTRSLPPIQTPAKLASDRWSVQDAAKPTKESQDERLSFDKWEPVTPVPINPNNNFDAQWLKDSGGEQLPRKREIYDIQSGSRSNTPTDNPESTDTEEKPTSPSLDIEEGPDATTVESAPTAIPEQMRQSFSAEGPRAHNWSGFPSLIPSLSQQLDRLEASTISQQSMAVDGLANNPVPTPHGLYDSSSLLPGNVTEPSRRFNTHILSPDNCIPDLQCNLDECVEQQLFPRPEPCLQQPFHGEDFSPTPAPHCPPNPAEELETYYGKTCVPTQRPLVELWRPFYGDGIFSPAIPVFSDVNPLMPQFILYGDYRAGVGVHRNNGDVRSIANRLALDMDLRLTGTERIHGFMAPLDNNNEFTRLDFSNSRDVRFESEMDAQFETGFFEGDLGAIYGGLTGQDAPFDLPIAAGLMPLIYQNGIWMEDNVAGVAIALPWQHSKELNWSNYDITFFALFDQITSPAFDINNGVASAFGTAWFIEAYDGYIEADYAYMVDRVDDSRSYHNTALAYTRRYFERVSNSIRVINNYGQDRLPLDRTADGTLLLLENSFLTSQATTFIPYANFFYGIRRPQSVARAAAAGGVLRNTGILFESDNLTGYPTLDATGTHSYGGAFGINTFASDFRKQFVLEFAALDTYGNQNFSAAAGPEYGFGGRYQQALTNWTLIRLDAMVGLRDGDSDIYGSRAEWRWKF